MWQDVWSKTSLKQQDAPDPLEEAICNRLHHLTIANGCYLHSIDKMHPEEIQYFNSFAETEETRNHLPHWQQTDVAYFVTFRLGDAIPSNLIKQWESERLIWESHHPRPWSDEVEQEYHRRFSKTMDRWLDAGYGSCLLRDSTLRCFVHEALQFFENVRCQQICWVVMPNHVHALFTLKASIRLNALLQSWKRQSARRINLTIGSTGSLWQKDYFDRIIRDGGHLENCVKYIRNNPVKAKLLVGEYELYESEFAKSIE